VIRRTLEKRALERAKSFPVVTITGPRQSGKTTLCQTVFPDHPYATLESPDVRTFATSDPRGFLGQFKGGAVLDEVQRVPELLSYLQEIVDARRRNGEWILTGSQNFSLLSSLSQSLAGRTSILHLLPLSFEELQRFPSPPRDLFQILFGGGYPRIYQEEMAPQDFYDGYVTTYVERDARQVLNIGDLSAFQTFLALCAGRSGQLLNFSSLGSDAGISYHTAKAWLSVLEAGFLAFRLRPFHQNFSKRLVKTPKLYFYDSGLLCYLLGIRAPEQLLRHPLRGAIFETWIVSEILKMRTHAGRPPDMYFYRNLRGLEIDLVLASGNACTAIEVKSGQTIAPDFFDHLEEFQSILKGKPFSEFAAFVVYGGSQEQRRKQGHVLPWNRITQLR